MLHFSSWNGLTLYQSGQIASQYTNNLPVGKVSIQTNLPLFACLILQQGKKVLGCFPSLYCSIGNANLDRLSFQKSDLNFIAISVRLMTKHIMEKCCVWWERNKTYFLLFTIISHIYKTKMNSELAHSSISTYKN